MGNQQSQATESDPGPVALTQEDVLNYFEVKLNGDVISMNVTPRSYKWILGNDGRDFTKLWNALGILEQTLQAQKKTHLVVHDRVSSQETPVPAAFTNEMFNDLLSKLAKLKDNPLTTVDLVAHIVELYELAEARWYPIPNMPRRREKLGGIGGKNVVMAKESENLKWNEQLQKEIKRVNDKKEIVLIYKKRDT